MDELKPKSVMVTANAPNRVQEAKEWAVQHNYLYTEETAPAADYLIIFAEDRIGIQAIKKPHTNAFYLDYTTGRLGFRAHHASKQNELLAKAVGLKGKKTLSVIDATAGLGRDAWILATLGAHVILLERSPILALLLHDAIARSKPLETKVQLIHCDATHWLTTHIKQKLIKADVIYLDPMFPERSKTAAIKKEMVILRDLVGSDLDAVALFESALACPVSRIVVKRPIHAHEISPDVSPTYSIKGRANRFDVYIRSVT